MCIEHYDETITRTAEAFDIINDQLDTWYQNWNTHEQ